MLTSAAAQGHFGGAVGYLSMLTLGINNLKKNLKRHTIITLINTLNLDADLFVAIIF